MTKKIKGSIRFIHFKDGKEHVFEFETNPLTNDVIASFDNECPVVDAGARWTKSVVKDIYKKATKVIEHTGDFKNP